MTTILLKENEPFEVAIRRFRRAIEKNGLIAELRERQSYEKPTTARKRKKAAAVKRLHKRLRSQSCRKSCTKHAFHSTAERRCELRKKPHRRFAFGARSGRFRGRRVVKLSNGQAAFFTRCGG